MTHTFRAALLGSSALLLLSMAHAAAAAEAAAADGGASDNVVTGVVVTAPREEVVARQRQFDAPNIVDIQSAETIQKYPDVNAAEALGRMPGVSISSDTGEGRFVTIRGIDGNLLGATFGGVPLLNTNPGGTNFGGGGRAVEYDTIPTGSIDGLVVTKTTLPDHEAEGLGGTIELTPRSAANVRAPFADAALGWGYEPAHEHTGPLNSEGAVGARFGFDGSHLIVEGQGDHAERASFFSNPTPFSLVLTASRRDDRRGFDDIEEDYNDPTVDRSYADLQLRRYDYHRRRFGYGGEFDVQPNDDHLWYLRANVAGYKEAVRKNILTYNALGDDPDPAHPGAFATTTNVRLASTDEEETHRNQVYAVGGRDQFGDVVLDYRASYSRATFAVGKNYGAKFNGPQGMAFAYDNTGDDGDFPKLTVNNALINDPTQYSAIKTVTNSTQNAVDQERAYAANLLFPVHLLGEDDKLKVGAQARLRDKEVMPSAFRYAISPLTLAAASSGANSDYYDSHYTNGPQIDTISVRNAANAGVVSGGVDQSGILQAKEDIYAGYGQYETRRGPWGLLAGVRVERTDARYGAFSDDNPTQTLAFVTRSKSYTNAFPTVQLRYQLSDNALIRATYSTGIGRPGFNQNTAAISSNHDVTDPQITQGNPNLNPTTGSNFDVSFEYYLPHGGILELGLFDKEFKNYIVTQFHRQLYTGNDPAFQGLIVGVTSFANRNDAYARGAEAAYHQQFDWLPGVWNGLGVDANLTLVDSHIEEYDAATSASGHAESGLLPGTSRMTANLAGFYEKDGLQVRLAGEYVSKVLFSLGGSKATDTIEDKRLTLDLTSSYRVTSNVTAYASVKNLTNEPLRFFVNDASFPIQREIYDQTYEAGLRARF
jgi:TonB-dependent receptor